MKTTLLHDLFVVEELKQQTGFLGTQWHKKVTYMKKTVANRCEPSFLDVSAVMNMDARGRMSVSELDSTRLKAP